MRIVHCIRQKSPHKILGAKRLDETVGIAPEFNAAVLCVLYQLHEPVHLSRTIRKFGPEGRDAACDELFARPVRICHFTSSAERTRPIKGRNPDSTLAIDFVARKATFESSAFRQVSMIPSAFSRTVRATG